MKYQIDHDYHIHSFLSPCSRDPEQNPERILRYAKENGFRHVVLTNHLWDTKQKNLYLNPPDQKYEYLAQALPLPQADGISFHFGCETDMDMNFVLGIEKETFDKLDFVILSTTHLQLTGKTVREGASLKERANICIKRLEKLLGTDFIDFTKVGIPHPASGHASPDNPFNELFDEIGEENIRRVFTEIAKSGAGVEVNSFDFNFSNKSAAHAEAILKFYGILRECGCKFYMGSDAHHPDALDRAYHSFETAVNELGLTEDEKFKMW